MGVHVDKVISYRPVGYGGQGVQKCRSFECKSNLRCVSKAVEKSNNYKSQKETLLWLAYGKLVKIT